MREDRVEAAGLDVAENEIGQRAAGVDAVEPDAAARVARLIEGDVAQFEISAEFQEVFAALPRKRVNELIDLVGTAARPDLPLQIVDAEPAFRTADRYARRPVMHRLARDAGQSHQPGHVELLLI